MKRSLKFAGWGLGALVGIAAAVVIWLSTSLPVTSGKVAVMGLAGPVEIYRDRHGVPHIFAKSEGDGFFALGYVHAQDRLWQMELLRRIGEGRLAEIVGPAGVPTDKTIRTLGLYRAAKSALAGLDPPTREVLERYADGVNAWISGHKGALPLEFTLLRYRPEPWKPVDSIVWGKLMALQLGLNFRVEALRAALLQHMAPQRVAELWPGYPADGPTIVETAKRAAAELHPEYPAGDPLGFAARGGLAWPFDEDVPQSASNAWAVSGARTKSGKPLLANDPHLGFSAPILWYLARLETPDLTLTGATVPGVPFFILGHNRKVAWGMTSAQTDQQDLFIERRGAGDQDTYDTPDGPKTFETREEIIHVRGAPDSDVTVRVSRHGPILYDRPPWSAGTAGGVGEIAVALSDESLKPTDTTAEALYHMAHASSAAELRDAARFLVAPQQNLLFADTSGHIGYVPAGATPIRRAGDGAFAQPGWDGAHDWVGTIPFHDLPSLLDPPSGRIVSANNRIVDNGYPYFLGKSWAPPYRAQRILDMLGERRDLTAAQFVAMQHDDLSLVARDLLPLMTAFTPTDPDLKRALDMLRAWNGEMTRDRAEPLLFTEWLRALNAAIYADELKGQFRQFFRLRALFVKSVLSGHTEWCDDVRTPDRTESCKDMLEISLAAALKDLRRHYGPDMTAWRWRDAHIARFTNRVLDRVPVLRALANLSIPTDGGNGTVNRGTTSIAQDSHPFDHIHGPGFRAVYDLADLDRSRFIIATGQSGNVLSRHYRDLLGDWRDGRTLTIAGSREELARRGAELLTLSPK